MSNFLLTTDTSCDVLKHELSQNGIFWTPLTFVINNACHEDRFDSDSEYTDFYNQLRDGSMPTTSQINIFTHEEFFESAIKKGEKNIMHLSLSGGLSSTASSAQIAANNVMGRHSDVMIKIVDTLSATQGHRFILDKALKLRQDGLDLDSAFETITKLCTRVHHLIIVDDLMHLKRGGRVSGAAAYVGSVLKIKPLLVINNVGKLAILKKLVGFNKAITEVVSLAREHLKDPNNPEFYIASADCGNNAERLHDALKEAFPTAKITQGWIGPVIGSHTGAGTLGLVFEGNERMDIE